MENLEGNEEANCKYNNFCPCSHICDNFYENEKAFCKFYDSIIKTNEKSTEKLIIDCFYVRN